ncbi:hypothetical protein DPMN_149668 [Dreissena polymorpha]|uniref:Uncharacterized protein n=1 Tax=Dreissena polymorpha TaxID=45954 RepID=A0A9D4J1B4_DREPO|nr:hypothetical protein DPMN_149668 [Dreissena polymorpha]
MAQLFLIATGVTSLTRQSVDKITIGRTGVKKAPGGESSALTLTHRIVRLISV